MARSPRADNPFSGLSAANMAAQLGALRDNSRIQQALQMRAASRVLGVPPHELAPEDDDMLAGGNIVVHRGPGGAFWVACALVLGAGLLGGAWLLSGGRQQLAGPVLVGPTTPRPAPPPGRQGGDYIEFYRP